MNRAKLSHLLFAATIIASAAACGPGNNEANNSTNNTNAETNSSTANANTNADTPAAVGEECSTDPGCVDDATCVVTDSGNVCMQNCVASETPLCDDGAVCVEGRDSDVCYTGGTVEAGGSCQTGLDCATGLSCFLTPSETSCRETCVTNDQCGDGEVCNVIDTTGFCIQALGAACSNNMDCGGGDVVCTRQQEGAEFLAAFFPGGYCLQFDCTTDDDCPGDGVCTVLEEDGRTLCMDTCETSVDCRSDYKCISAGGCTEAEDRASCELTVGDDSLCVAR